jgi:hypothetical protein
MEGNLIACSSGIITCSTFVSVDTTQTTPNQGNRVVQSPSGGQPIGVAQKGSRYTPYPGLNPAPGNLATTGTSVQELQVYTIGQWAPLLLGGTVTAGALLMPDLLGGGTAITHTASNWYGAQAPMSGISGQIMDCLVMPGYN